MEIGRFRDRPARLFSLYKVLFAVRWVRLDVVRFSVKTIVREEKRAAVRAYIHRKNQKSGV
ncbi:MAG: hypothetical protein M1339_05760 [Bacteroidetes bacterium]|nr:hypothetical protein [Bacteroidota bacterium]